MLEKLELNRFGIVATLLITIACLGAFAAATVIDNLFMLSVVVACTMSVESFMLAVQPMKRIFTLSTISGLVNILAILFG